MERTYNRTRCLRYITACCVSVLILHANCGNAETPLQTPVPLQYSTPGGPPPSTNCGSFAVPFKPNPYLKYRGPTLYEVEKCFQKAYKKCTPMSMTVITNKEGESSITATYRFMQKETTCRISGTMTGYFPDTANPVRHSDFTCDALMEKRDFLVLVNCNGTDITIPRQ